MTKRTNSTIVIKIKEYKPWVSDHLLKADGFALHPKVIALFEEANGLIESEYEFFSSRGTICETISRNTSKIVSKTTHKVP